MTMTSMLTLMYYRQLEHLKLKAQNDDCKLEWEYAHGGLWFRTEIKTCESIIVTYSICTSKLQDRNVKIFTWAIMGFARDFVQIYYFIPYLISYPITCIIVRCDVLVFLQLTM